jgi:metal-responsive CopG/Arc/MetJ family transcriptional regulator
MRRVSIVLDEQLVERLDEAARSLRTTRSAITRDALEHALARLATTERERRHRRGYQVCPIEPGEFDW